MRILKQDVRHGFVHVMVEHVEDLWYLSHIIDPGDLVRGSTERKIKIGGEDARNQKVVRKKMLLTLSVEKVTFAEHLRVLGVIVEGPEDVARGEHHSFNVSEGDSLGITKKQWANWQLEKLREAEGEKEKILVVLFDRESALFALLRSTGHSILSHMKGNVQKKGADEVTKSHFWKDVVGQLEEYVKKYEVSTVICASSHFWKEYVKKEMDGELLKKVVFATVSSVDETALNELVRRPELKVALKKDRSAKEIALVGEILVGLSRDQVAYGIEEVTEKVAESGLKTLLVSDHLLMKKREEGYEELDALLRAAEAAQTEVTIITTEDALKQLDGLGGLAGMKRW